MTLYLLSYSKGIALFLLILSFGTSIDAQTAQWNGSADTNWDNAANWTFANGGALTNASTIYTIPNNATGPTTASNASLNMRQLNVNSNATATLPSGFILDISGAGGVGLTNKGTIDQNGNLTISSTSNNSLRNEGTFDLNSGILTIESPGRDGISNASGGTFNNASTIHIGQSSSIGDEGIWNGSDAIFNNNASGVIHIYNAAEVGIYNESGTFNNAGMINIGQGGSPGAINFEGIWAKNDFFNLATGIIKIDNAGAGGVKVEGGNGFSNSGQLLIGTTGTSNNIVPIGLEIITGSFHNSFGATLKVDNTSGDGIKVIDGNTLLNGGDIMVGTIGTVGNHGINVVSGAALKNEWADILVSNATENAYNIAGTFTNSTGTIKGVGIFNYVSSTSFSGTLSPGNSPGTITFNHDQTFTSGSDTEIEVNGPTPDTEHDQIVVNGIATLAGQLRVSINYTPMTDTRIVIVSATTISGNYLVSPALPDNWTIDYSMVGEVALVYIAPLPVELINFFVTLDRQQALLQWSTATEVNNMGFEIQHSIDGKIWNYVDFVYGKGATLEKQDYSFPHDSPSNGINYYRLRQVDYNGLFEYSVIQSVEIETIMDQIKVFPQPASTFVNIQLPGDFQNATISIRSSNGQAHFNQTFQNGEAIQAINISTWTDGMYFVYITIDDYQYIHKLIISNN